MKAFAYFSAATLLIVSLALPAQAVQPTSDNNEPVQLSEVEKQAIAAVSKTEDARFFAQQTGQSADESLQELEGQATFSQLIQTLGTSYADDFVYGEWSPKGATRGFIVLTTDASPEAVAAIASSGVPLTVTRSKAPSERDRDRATAAAYQSALEDLGTADLSGDSDYATGAITISYSPAVKAKLADPTVKSKAKKKVKDAIGQDIDVSFVESALVADAGLEYRGGLPYPGGCTGGFVVRSGSTYGISTARHCSVSSFSYDGGSFVFQSQLPTGEGDIKWSRATAGGAASTFQYYPNMFRIATAAINPAVGTFTCKYGMTTGQTCSNVVATGKCGNGYCGLTVVNGAISEGGDSGGPWFNGSTAHGIHHGKVEYNGAVRSAFTRIGAINLLNAVVNGT